MMLRLKFVKLSLLISMRKENRYAKMEKLEAQICTRLKLCPEKVEILRRNSPPELPVFVSRP